MMEHPPPRLVFLINPLSVPALLVGTVVVVGMVWYGASVVRSAGRLRGGIFVGLRSAAFAVLCAVLLEPSLVEVTQVEVPLPKEFFRKVVRIFTKGELDALLPPLSSLPVPQAEPSMNVSVEGVVVPPVAFYKSECSIMVQIDNDGPPREVELVISRLEKSIRETVRTRVSLKPGLQEVEARLTPDAIGWTAWSVGVTGAVGDTNLDDNNFVFGLTVVRESVRILHIAGRPSWDVHFLRKLLTSTPGTELVSFYLLVEAKDFAPHSREELALIPFPTDELFIREIGNFDLIVLHNFPLGTYFLLDDRHLSRLVEYVREGGGLLFLGGDKAFTLGKVHETPVADVVPAVMPAGDAAAVYVEGPFAARLAPDGLSHPVTSMSDKGTEEPLVLAHLPLLSGVNRLAEPAAWGQVLVTASRPGEELPLVVAGQYGKGRVVVLATDSLWRWAFPAEMAHDPPSVYRRLLLNSVLWLSGDPRMAGMRLEGVDAEPVEGKAVAVSACIRGEAEPGWVAHVSAQWVDPSGRLPSISAEQDVPMTESRCGLMTLPPTGPGVWLLQGRLEAPDREYTGDGVVVVKAQTETWGSRLRGKMMPILKTHYAPFDMDRPFEVTPGPETLAIDKPVVTPLLDSPFFFILFVALLALEWFLRKRWGYL